MSSHLTTPARAEQALRQIGYTLDLSTSARPTAKSNGRIIRASAC